MRRSRPPGACTPDRIDSLDKRRKDGRTSVLPILGHGVVTSGIYIRLQSTASIITSCQSIIALSSSMGLCPWGRYGFLDRVNWGNLNDAQKQPWAVAHGAYTGSLRLAREDAARFCASGINEFTTSMADLVAAFGAGLYAMIAINSLYFRFSVSLSQILHNNLQLNPRHPCSAVQMVLLSELLEHQLVFIT